MTDTNIHPTAVVESGVSIGKDVVIEPYAIVKGNVTLHDGVVIKSHAYVEGNTTIGEGTIIFPFASIGTKTQDLKFGGERTEVIIGKNSEIREYVTINSSCGENSQVVVGDECLIMAYCHVAHNCSVGNRVVMANGATLAGHVTVEDNAIIGGMTPIHQFARVGCYAMVGGMSVVLQDVPPYTIGRGIEPYRVGGLNMIGLKRQGFDLETRRCLTRAFKLVYRSGLHLDEALATIEKELDGIPEIQHWLDFCRHSKRGLVGLRGITQKKESEKLHVLQDYEEQLALSQQNA